MTVLAKILAEHLPLGLVMLRQIDPDRSALETVAVGAADQRSLPDVTRSECSSKALKEILAWCKRGELIHQSATQVAADRLGCMIPTGLKGDLLAMPLSQDGAPPAIMLLVADGEERFTEAHESIARSIAEPFAVVLANDRRFREVASLREAAEADKRSLLSRLGREELGEVIIGRDGGLKLVTERIKLVARSDMPVLLLGETGSGKEVVARAIHSASDRAGLPFMRINCGAIAPELIDSELFGHERGSFTGATATRQGWFERADGGTLFLDEIAELPVAAQVRLLRVLQDGSFERVGGHTQLSVDVRIVAATHRDLPAMIDQGRFREDLWYRIAAFPVRLPPLRERIEDIPALANHFAQRAAKRFGLPVLAPTSVDVKLLASYAWPGNVREFAAVMDRAAILGEGQKLEVAKALGLGFEAPASRPPATNNAPAAAATVQSNGDIATLDQAMAQHISCALQATRGRIEGSRGAAQLLGINPHTLRARMRKLHIDWKSYRA